MAKKARYGKCVICGKECKLSYEHIPPKSAFNTQPVKSITGKSFIELVTSKDRLPWDVDGLKYDDQQKGMGKYSLCDSCNNYTGTMYGDEYGKLARDCIYILQKAEGIKDANILSGEIKEFYPLRFIKQVLSMFCSTTDELTMRFPEIRELLLDKNKIINDPDFKIYFFLIKTERIAWTGINALGIKGYNEPVVVSQIDAFPFGFIFDFDKNHKYDGLADITSYLSYGYNDKINRTFQLPIYERNMPFPLDFRTKEQILLQ